ncbi:MAG: hypothetical protein IJI43_01570 [Bacilli bacterium]|nr:hypothetical protein [Bacilli bacterium]
MDNTNINSNHSKKGLLRIVLLLVMAVVLITLGITMNRLGNSLNIIEKSINITYDNIKNILMVNRDKTDIGTTFTIDGTLSSTLSGSYITNTYGVQNKYRKTRVILSQNINEKKLLLKVADKPSNINARYLIENSTGYYYIQGFKNTYINTGTNNYFENITSNDMLSEYRYLLDKTVESLVKCIDKDKVSQEKAETYIDNDSKKLTKTMYTIDNKESIDLINNLLKELREDEQSKKILLNISKELFEKEVPEETIILDKDDTITYSVYTDILYNIKKIELVMGNNTISYEILKDSDLIRVISNNNSVTKFYITRNSNKYNIVVKDGKDKQLGTMTIENTETKNIISINFSDANQKIDLSFNRDLTNIVSHKSYDSKIGISLTITDLKTTEKSFIANIDITSKVVNASDIKEDTSTAILSSSLTEIDNNKLKTILQGV